MMIHEAAPVRQWVHMLRRLYWRLVRPTTRGSRVLILDEENILLVRHTYGPWWYLPGGGARRGEMFDDAAQREVHEETGLEVQHLRFLNMYFSQQEGKRDRIAVFATTMYEGIPHVRSREIAEVQFHPLHALPHDVSPATRRRITEYLEGTTSDLW